MDRVGRARLAGKVGRRGAGRDANLVFLAAQRRQRQRCRGSGAIHDEIDSLGVDPLAADRDRHVAEPDRRAAIRAALTWAEEGDVVVIAGKGHEPYQIIGTDVLPFDDRAEARAVLEERPS